MNIEHFVILVFTISCVQAGRLTHALNSPQTHYDPDFTNATLIRSFTTFQLMTKTKMINLINLPDVRQATYYTCGPSSLQAVLMYYGIQEIQLELAQMTKADQDFGTSIHEMLRVTRQFGLKAEHRFNMTLPELQGYLSKKIPVIVLIQAWLDDYEEDIDWNDIWEDGHYVVAIGSDDRYIYFEDPSILGGIGYIPKGEFLDRWHDYDVDITNKYIHYGMPVEGKPSSVYTAQLIQ